MPTFQYRTMINVVYVFACRICRKRFEMDEPGEPVCSGPNESADDHPHELMRLVRVHRRDVGPTYAERRVAGPLLIPGGLLDDRIQTEVKLALVK